MRFCRIYSVSQQPPLKFSDTFPKRLGIFSPNCSRLLYVHIYAGLQFFIQLGATLTTLLSATTIMCSKCPIVHHRPKHTLGGRT